MNNDAPPRTIGRVPVNNLWFLMLYASDLIRIAGGPILRLYDDDVDDVAQLIGNLLARAAEERLRRSITQKYMPRARILRRVRGRIDVLETTTRRLLSKGEVSCRFEELTIDIPRNRLLRVALEQMGRLISGNVGLRCRSYARYLARMGVGAVLPTAAQITSDVIGRNDAHDRPVVALSRLALDLALPTEDDGLSASYRPLRDEVWVRKLFERAMRGFCATEFRDRQWRVSGGDYLCWQTEHESPALRSLLPRMETDIMIDAPDGRRMVIDTKFTSIMGEGKYGAPSFKSGHVFQLYAYLRSQEGRDPRWQSTAGLLLYPSLGETIREQATIQGHKVSFATVDLRRRASYIRQELLALLPGALE